MILDVIKKSKDNKSLIGFNFYGSDQGFYCGYTIGYSEEIIIIQHFSKFGIYDGILVHKISDIQYFETDTAYLKGIHIMIQSQNEILKQSYTVKKINDNIATFTTLFENFIGNKEYLIKFELTDDEIYFGFIEWCDEEFFSIINIDNDGSIVGKAIYRFEDLKLYWIDDLESRKRKILYTAKHVSR